MSKSYTNIKTIDSVREFLRYCPSCPLTPCKLNEIYHQTKPLGHPKKLKLQRRKKSAKRHPPCHSVSCPNRIEQIAQPTIRVVGNNLALYSQKWDTDRFAKTLKLFHSITMPYLNKFTQKQHKEEKVSVQKKKCKSTRNQKCEQEHKKWLNANVWQLSQKSIKYLLKRQRLAPNYKQVRLGLRLNKKLQFNRKHCLKPMVIRNLEKYCIILATVVDTICEPYKRELALKSLIEIQNAKKKPTKKQCVFNLEKYAAGIRREEEEEEGIIEEFSEVSFFEDTVFTEPFKTLSLMSQIETEEVFPKQKRQHKRIHYIKTLNVEEDHYSMDEENEAEIDYVDIYEEVHTEGEDHRESILDIDPADLKQIIHRIYESGYEEHYYVMELTLDDDLDGVEEEMVRHMYRHKSGRRVSFNVDPHAPPSTITTIRQVIVSALGVVSQNTVSIIPEIPPGYTVTEEHSVLEMRGYRIPVLTQYIHKTKLPTPPMSAAGSEDGSIMQPYVEEEEEVMGEDVIYSESMSAEEEATPPVSHEITSASHTAWCLYMAWLTEFGNNLTIYQTCLARFRSVLGSDGNNERYVDSITAILKNWGNYLQDSRFAEQNMMNYFKDKPVTYCGKCCTCTIDDYPKGHYLPKELSLAITTTKMWRELLQDAEKYCRTLGESDESDSEVTSYNITRIASSSSSDIDVFSI